MTKEGGEDRGNTWWWSEQVKDAIDRKKKAFKLWCTNRSMECKINYGKARNPLLWIATLTWWGGLSFQ